MTATTDRTTSSPSETQAGSDSTGRGSWRSRLQRFSLRTKVVIPMVTLSVLPVTAVGYFASGRMRSALAERQIERIEFDTSARAGALEGFLQGLHRDLRVLSEAAAVEALGAAAVQPLGGVDQSASSSHLASLREAAAREITTFSRGRRGYRELRFLNNQAREVLRLEMSEGRATLVGADGLDSEIDRQYASTLSEMNLGQVYISEIPLDPDPASAESAPGRVLSCATPVAWDNPTERGLLVVNVDPAYMFSLIRPLPEATEAWLINQQGIYLGYLGESAEKRETYAMGRRRPLSADFEPAEVISIRDAAAGPGTIERPDAVLSFAPVQFDAAADAQRWTLLIAQPIGPVLAPVSRMERTLWLLVAAAALSAGLMGILVASYVLRPVRALSRATVEIAAGDLTRVVDVSTGDEIAGLAENFNTMTGRLRDAQDRLGAWNEDLQSEVARQTDRLRSLQAGLARADKLASVGQMAASVMHEIGNPLAAIKTKIQVAEEAELCDECRELLPTLVWEVDRLSTVLRSFSRLGKLGAETMESVSLAEVVDGVSTLIGPELNRKRMKLVTKVDGDVPSIRGAPDQLRQLLINFILNAADASEEGARILVRVTDSPTPPDPNGKPGSVVVEIRDEGSGIQPENLSQIWDPLFTTKVDGTGLGLAICRQIVRDHGGTVTVRSEPDSGTTVEVTFPAPQAGP